MPPLPPNTIPSIPPPSRRSVITESAAHGQPDDVFELKTVGIGIIVVKVVRHENALSVTHSVSGMPAIIAQVPNIQ